MAENMKFNLELDTGGFVAGIQAAGAAAMNLGSSVRASLAGIGASGLVGASLVQQQTQKLSSGFVAVLKVAQRLTPSMNRLANLSYGFAASMERNKLVVGELLDRLENSLTNMKEGFEQIISAFSSIEKESNKIKEIWSKSVKILEFGATTTRNKWLATFINIAKFAASKFFFVGQIAVKVFQTAGIVIFSVTKRALSLVTGLIKGLAIPILSLASTIGQLAVIGGRMFFRGFVNVIKKIARFMRGSFTSAFTVVIPAARKATSSLVRGVASGVGSIARAPMGITTKILGLVATVSAISYYIRKLVEIFQGSEGLAEFNRAISYLVLQVVGSLKAIGTFIANAFGGVNVGGIFQQILAFIIRVGDAIRENLPMIVSKLIEFLATTLEIANAIVNMVSGAMQGDYSAILKFLSDIGVQVLSFIQPLTQIILVQVQFLGNYIINWLEQLSARIFMGLDSLFAYLKMQFFYGVSEGIHLINDAWVFIKDKLLIIGDAINAFVRKFSLGLAPEVFDTWNADRQSGLITGSDMTTKFFKAQDEYNASGTRASTMNRFGSGIFGGYDTIRNIFNNISTFGDSIKKTIESIKKFGEGLKTTDRSSQYLTDLIEKLRGLSDGIAEMDIEQFIQQLTGGKGGGSASQTGIQTVFGQAKVAQKDQLQETKKTNTLLTQILNTQGALT
jgi:hypothetical protein